MMIKYENKYDPQIDLTPLKVYSVLAMEKGWYRIIDDSGEDYLYPPELFQVVEED